MNTIDSLIAMNERYRKQRDNLDRIIAENERRIRQAQTLHDPVDYGVIDRRDEQIGKPGPAIVAVGDDVDIDYRKPTAFWERNTPRQFVGVTVAAFPTGEHVSVRWEDERDGEQFRTLRRDRIEAIREFHTQEPLVLPEVQS